jgi:hypothetical protein
MMSTGEKAETKTSLEKAETKTSLEKASDSQLAAQSTVDSEHFDFGGESTLPPPPTLTAEEERKLWQKIDLRLMPYALSLPP